MAIKEELTHLRDLMKEMLLVAENSDWEKLIIMDKERSKLVNKISLSEKISEHGVESIVSELIDLDHEIMDICINRKKTAIAEIASMNKAMKGLDEYLKHD